MNEQEIKAFVKERDAALLSMDRDQILAHMKKWEVKAPSADIFWLAIHKARTAATSLPMFERAASKWWLMRHGSYGLDDGDVLPPTESRAEMKKYFDRCKDFEVL